MRRQKAADIVEALGRRPPIWWADDLANYPSEARRMRHEMKAADVEARVKAKYGWTE